MKKRRMLKSRVRPRRPAPAPPAKTIHRGSQFGKRGRGMGRSEQFPFVPPEDWHESLESRGDFRVALQPPGDGFRHVVTVKEVRARLAQLPAKLVEPLEVVQFSRMTRKKQSFPCYGMQWGTSIYLYPIEEDLVEYFPVAPRPQQIMEARMYGGRWVQNGAQWHLKWTAATIRDFYLNNILIHELGHLLDDRNRGYVDRERYAEWFALKYGYQATEGHRRRTTRQRVVRRRHAK